MTGTLAGTLIRHLRRMAAPPAARGLTDAQLLQRFATNGEDTAFASLLQRHGRLVWSVCRRILVHEQDAEDVFQAVFLVLARRAASIRKGESVASWLYGVAYRIAMKAKKKTANRQKYEAQARSRSGACPTVELMCRELQALLDRELRKLPEKYRAPFVLCCMEGKGRKEAAEELGWKEGTLAGRLGMARQLLQRRLARRGVSLAVVLGTAALSETASAALLPTALMKSTLQVACCCAAGGGTAAMSASVAELVQGASQTMLWNKVTITAVLLLLIGVTGLGIATQRAADPPTLTPPARAQTPGAKQAPAAAPKEAADEIVISGRVLGPDGKPFEGAKVYLWTDAVKVKKDMQAGATTGADGRFRFSVPKDSRSTAKILATAKNQGPDWVELSELKKGDELTLRLVNDDVPIKGRVLDLEGKPVANATVRVVHLHQTDLDWWIKEMKRGRWYYPKSIGPDELGAAAQAATGADGRFRLRGLGRERLVYIEISGETIERIRCWTMTRARETSGLPKEGEPVYTAVFDHIAGPCKPIVGTVREKGTGKPLAGITVRFSGPRQWINSATTDADGKFRIVGIAKQREYALAAAGTPYFATTKESIADTPGFDPITVNFELERGVEIRGRLFNKATGEPIKADVTYHAFADNPHLKKVAGLDQGAAADRRNKTKADGSFFVVGLPGPGLLTVLADEDDYLKPDRPADWKKAVPYVNLAPPLLHAWVRINPSETDPKSTRVEIALEPAKPIPGRVLDPDGKPLGGCFIAGLTGSPILHSYQVELHEKPSFQIRGVDPNRPRTVVFIHLTKKLGEVRIVRRDEGGPLEVRLKPLSAVMGRILDAEGGPRAALQVRARVIRIGNEDDNKLPTLFQLEEGLQFHHLAPQGATDAGGHFRLDGLLPGLQYTLEVRAGEGGDLVKLNLPPDGWTAAASGQTKDLGDLKSKR